MKMHRQTKVWKITQLSLSNERFFFLCVSIFFSNNEHELFLHRKEFEVRNAELEVSQFLCLL